MPNFSLRDIDVATLSRIKSVARRQKRSINRVIVETLQQHYANGQRAPDEIDALAGSWSAAEVAEFNAAIAPFGEIDAAIWASPTRVAQPRPEYRVTRQRATARAESPPGRATATRSKSKK